MIQIIWGLLHIVALVFLVVLCFHWTKTVREKLGVVAAVVFVFVLVSFVSKPSDQDVPHKIYFQNPKIPFIGNTHQKSVRLEDNMATNIDLFIGYGTDGKSTTLLQASSNQSGFVSGTTWKTRAINVSKLGEKEVYFYTVSGILEWKFIGITIFSEEKSFEGKTEL